MGDGVSVREFARHIGKSHVWVLNLIQSGNLPRNEDGTIPLEAGMKAYTAYKSMPKKHGRPKKTNAETPKKKSVKKKQPLKPKKEKQKRVIEPEEINGEPVLNHVDPPSYLNEERTKEAVSINAALNKAKLAEKTYQAKLRELDYKFRKGELLEASDVAKEAQWLAEQVKSKLLAIPPRVSSLCEGRTSREIEEIITDSINDALKELQKSKYKGDSEK